MKNYIIEIKWGIIFVIMQLAWMTMEMLFGFHDKNIANHAIITNFVMIPAVTIYVLALLDKKKNFFQGNMSYKQGLISGAIISVVVTIFSPATQYIVSMLITPEYFANIIKYSVENDLMTQTEAEEMFNLNSYIIQTLLFTPIMGIITSAIVAFFVRSKELKS